MRVFIAKAALIILIAIGLSILRVFFLCPDINNAHYFRNMPLNNVSNSPCFKAKLDHLANSDYFKNSTFLIGGSSMSLNNISGSIINQRTNFNTYNISSWNFKPKQLNQFIKTMKKNNTKYLLLAFNNLDFGDPLWDIDFQAADSYINENTLERYLSFIKKFNINTFANDWNYKNKYSDINNHYESLNFDQYGSIQFEPQGFVIDEKRWNYNSIDTIGFNIFYNNISELNLYCLQNNISFILVYTPLKPDLLTEDSKIQMKAVSDILNKKLGKSFVDLHDLKIPVSQFCDGTHLFKDGAEMLTNIIVDSVEKRTNLHSYNLQPIKSD